MIAKFCVLLLAFYAASAQQNCPSGWHKLEHKCYYVANSNNTLFHNMKVCMERNSTLVSLHSQKEVDLLMSILPKDVYHWIGLKRTAVSSTIFKWSDGSPVDFTIWDLQRPAHLEKSPWGAVLVNGKWADAYATNMFAEMCQIVLSPGANYPGQTSSECFAYIEKKVDNLESLYKNLAGLQKNTHGRINEIGNELLTKLIEVATKVSKSD